MNLEIGKGKFYPKASEVDAWIEEIWRETEKIAVTVEVLPDRESISAPLFRHTMGRRFVRFSPENMDPFYCFWQPTLSGPAPLLVHLPGYGAEMSEHPNFVLEGYNVLHVNPLGYATTKDWDTSKMQDGNFPVFMDTIKSRGQKGYKQWFMNCIMAVQWAQTQKEVIPERLSFFGSSQGGGASLLLTSIFKDKGVRCTAADLPYFCNLGTGYIVNDYQLKEEDLYGMGLVDTLSHLHRLRVPIMMTAGSEDSICTAASIKSFFDKLNGTKLFYLIDGHEHIPNANFPLIATGWFRLYA